MEDRALGTLLLTGYGNLPPAVFFGSLADWGADLAVDIRLNPWGWRPEYSRGRFLDGLRTAGIPDATHRADLGNRAYKTGGMDIGMRNSSTGYCGGKYLGWVACAEVRGSWTVWYVDLASNRCWMNGGVYRTCSTTSTFDVWTIILAEMLHANTLDHHVNPDRSDAVSQLNPIAYPNSGWQDRALRWADSDALFARFGSSSCTTSATAPGEVGPLGCVQ